MNKYRNSKLYRIVNQASTDPNDFYLGSTTSVLRMRFSNHKAAWKRDVDGKTKSGMRLYEEFTNFGIENFKIILIENYPCTSKEELLMREEALRLELKPNYNVQRAYRSHEELLKQHSKYRTDHPDLVAARKKKWCESNPNKHHCEACCYNTAIKSNYDFHLRTKKHKLEYEEYLFDIEMDRMADITIFD